MQEKQKQPQFFQEEITENNFSKGDLITPVMPFDGYELGKVYRVKGQKRTEKLGTCYLIKDKINDRLDEYPVMFAEARFINVTEKFHWGEKWNWQIKTE